MQIAIYFASTAPRNAHPLAADPGLASALPANVSTTSSSTYNRALGDRVACGCVGPARSPLGFYPTRARTAAIDRDALRAKDDANCSLLKLQPLRSCTRGELYTANFTYCANTDSLFGRLSTLVQQSIQLGLSSDQRILLTNSMINSLLLSNIAAVNQRVDVVEKKLTMNSDSYESVSQRIAVLKEKAKS